MTETIIAIDTGMEVEQCLPELRYVPAKTVGGPVWTLQQAWRISVIDGQGKNMGGRMEWRDVPFIPNPR